MNATEFCSSLMEIEQIISEKIDRIFIPYCRKKGISRSQFSILLELYCYPNQTVGNLSNKVGILKSNMASVCKKLEEVGLLRRMRSKRDERVVTLSLTPQGFDLIKESEDDLNESFGLILEDEKENLDKVFIGINALFKIFIKLDKQIGIGIYGKKGDEFYEIQ